MDNILKKIAESVCADLPEAKQKRPEAFLRKTIATIPERPRFSASFHSGEFRVIAELKKASPSKGLIRESFDVRSLACELEEAGAAALSVLTERHFFQGAPENLALAAQVSNLPLLRKDFILDPWQLLEAKADGASAVLLIAALFPSEEALRELNIEARHLGLEVLGEAHNEEEIELLSAIGTDCIGVNARDLKTFQTDLKRVERLLKLVPEDRIAIAESAISSHDDLRRLADAGAAGFLIGETLMRAPSPGRMLKKLLGRES